MLDTNEAGLGFHPGGARLRRRVVVVVAAVVVHGDRLRSLWWGFV